MTNERRETDYLVVGAGAMGMAFADVVCAEQPDAHVTLVDRRAAPGGHWNDAYPFVRLHQPAAFYGVQSQRLERSGSDLSSRAEILAYFERVLQRWESSGRIDFLPRSEVRDDGRIASMLDPERSIEISVRRKVVDASYMNVEVPATHGPRYEVDPEAKVVPPNALTRVGTPHDRYTVIGAGKTGIDAILFLLDRGVEASRIRWIVPNDMWMWNRRRIQPGIAGEELLSQLRAIAGADSLGHVFHRMEEGGGLFRLDPKVEPTKWRCATVDPDELEALRTVEDVVRLGRVERVGASELRLERGTLEARPSDLHVDCTANGLSARPPVPIFAKDRITLQSVFMCQQVFSAAIVAHLEGTKLDDATRNEIWTPVPHPELIEDLVPSLLGSVDNMLRGSRRIPIWLRRSRLNVTAHEGLFRFVANAIRATRILPEVREAAARFARNGAEAA